MNKYVVMIGMGLVAVVIANKVGRNLPVVGTLFQ